MSAELALYPLTLGISLGSIGLGLLMVLFTAASVLLILAVLIQKPQGGGLATAFGAGAGSGQTAFGARTGDALTVITIIFFVLFLGTGIGLVWLTTPAKATGAAEVAPGPTAATGRTGTAPATGAPAAATGDATPAPTPAPAPTGSGSTPPASTEVVPPATPASPAPTGGTAPAPAPTPPQTPPGR
jgi:preprotein translocase subunit SecG